jgi:hypothetical protein
VAQRVVGVDRRIGEVAQQVDYNIRYTLLR